MSRSHARHRTWGRCPNCGRVVRSTPRMPRPRHLHGLPVHAICYRRLTDPHHTLTSVGGDPQSSVACSDGTSTHGRAGDNSSTTATGIVYLNDGIRSLDPAKKAS